MTYVRYKIDWSTTHFHIFLEQNAHKANKGLTYLFYQLSYIRNNVLPMCCVILWWCSLFDGQYAYNSWICMWEYICKQLRGFSKNVAPKFMPNK